MKLLIPYMIYQCLICSDILTLVIPSINDLSAFYLCLVTPLCGLKFNYAAYCYFVMIPLLYHLLQLIDANGVNR